MKKLTKKATAMANTVEANGTICICICRPETSATVSRSGYYL